MQECPFVTNPCPACHMQTKCPLGKIFEQNKIIINMLENLNQKLR